MSELEFGECGYCESRCGIMDYFCNHWCEIKHWKEQLKASQAEAGKYKHLFEWLWAYGDFSDAEQIIIKEKLKDGSK